MACEIAERRSGERNTFSVSKAWEALEESIDFAGKIWGEGFADALFQGL